MQQCFVKNNMGEKEILNMGEKEILKMLEEKDKKREEEIRKVKLSNKPDWEKKMILKALRSSTYGWN
jgi:hypothetical protein